jgi:Trk-type K+ transport system membrane component
LILELIFDQQEKKRKKKKKTINEKKIIKIFTIFFCRLLFVCSAILIPIHA